MTAPPRLANTAVTIAPATGLHHELLALWNRAGRPSYQEMAATTGQAPARFENVLRDVDLSSWVDVKAVLNATGETDPAAIQRWHEYWRAVEKLPRTVIGKPGSWNCGESALSPAEARLAEMLAEGNHGPANSRNREGRMGPVS